MNIEQEKLEEELQKTDVVLANAEETELTRTERIAKLVREFNNYFLLADTLASKKDYVDCFRSKTQDFFEKLHENDLSKIEKMLSFESIWLMRISALSVIFLAVKDCYSIYKAEKAEKTEENTEETLENA